MYEACHTLPARQATHICMSQCVTYNESFIANICMRHVTHCLSHICMRQCVTCNESFITNCDSQTATGMSHIACHTYVYELATHINEACHTHRWVIAHRQLTYVWGNVWHRMSHPSRTATSNKPSVMSHIYIWGMSHIWMRHVTCMSYGVASISWLLKIIRLFCKRAL